MPVVFRDFGKKDEDEKKIILYFLIMQSSFISKHFELLQLNIDLLVAVNYFHCMLLNIIASLLVQQAGHFTRLA